MIQYIEREAAIESFRKNLDGGYVLTNDAQTTHILQSLPAADVRPVKRGKWTKEHLASTMGGTYPVVRCSVCGASLPFFEGTTYCPNCGAEMR